MKPQYLLSSPAALPWVPLMTTVVTPLHPSEVPKQLLVTSLAQSRPSAPKLPGSLPGGLAQPISHTFFRHYHSLHTEAEGFTSFSSCIRTTTCGVMSCGVPPVTPLSSREIRNQRAFVLYCFSEAARATPAASYGHSGRYPWPSSRVPVCPYPGHDGCLLM